MSIKRLIYLLLFTWVACNLYAQTNYYKYTQENFREESLFQETIDLKNIDIERINALTFYLTNEVRLKKRLSELNYHPKLEEAARLHSNQMVEKDFFNHINKRSKALKDPNSRARYVGISNPYLAENIVQSFVLQYNSGDKVFTGGKGVFRHTPDASPIEPRTYLSLSELMVESWMNSPPHRANILSKKAISLGCGTTFYLKKDFNDMPSVVATQNFQLYENIRVDD